MTYKPLSAMPERQRERYREYNRRHQAEWRARHPEQERAQQALKRWKQRRWKMAAGWTPMTPSERGRVAGLASAAARRDR